MVDQMEFDQDVIIKAVAGLNCSNTSSSPLSAAKGLDSNKDMSIYSDDDCEFFGDSEDNSWIMYSELETTMTSLQMSLAQFKDHLKTMTLAIKGGGPSPDEIALSYISSLDSSVNLLAASIETADRCQNQIIKTFQCLRNRISNLTYEKKRLQLQNEQLSLRVRDCNQMSEIETTERLCFLEEKIRKEVFPSSTGNKVIQYFDQLTEKRGSSTECSNCGRSSVRFSISSERKKQYLAYEALNLESDPCKFQKRRENSYPCLSNLEKKTAMDNSLTQYGDMPPYKSSVTLDELNLPWQQLELDMAIQADEYNLNGTRNYYISTDDLSSTPRRRLSHSHLNNIDINQIIENSWLETNSTLDERRASVFAQFPSPPYGSDDIVINVLSQEESSSDFEESPDGVTPMTRRTSSSYSSSNDTSDTSSIDVDAERIKLAQELENRNIRLQSRSPVPSLSGFRDEMKSITPTMNEDEQSRGLHSTSNYLDYDVFKPESRTNSVVSVIEKCSLTDPSSRKSSANRQSVIFNTNGNTDNILPNILALPRPSLPTISVVEVLTKGILEGVIHEPLEPSSFGEPPGQAAEKIMPMDSKRLSLQRSINKRGSASRSSSLAGGESKLPRRSRYCNKRNRRSFTVPGIGVRNTKMDQNDDSVSLCDDQSTTVDTSNVQTSIDSLLEMKELLSTLSARDLENKWNEMKLLYCTDQLTIVARANDADNKCNKAFINVEQEFSILRHLIKSILQQVEQSSEFVPRIKVSIGVLEKCVEYLSTKSEILGAIQQEMKLSLMIDVVNEYNSKITKEREKVLEELDKHKNTTTNMMGNGSYDLSRIRRSGLSGKDAKTRFQLLAQNTTTKSSIVRQLTPGSHPDAEQLSTSNNSCYVESSSNLDQVLLCQQERVDVSDSINNELVNDLAKMKKYGTPKYYSNSISVEESGENIFQRGLQQGLRLSTDQALTEMRVEQNRFSSNLDSLKEVFDEYSSLNKNLVGQGYSKYNRITIIKDKLYNLLTTIYSSIRRPFYLIIGLIVAMALFIPWLLAPPKLKGSSKSVPPVRRRIKSSCDMDDKSSTSSASSSPLLTPYRPVVNRMRRQPADD